MEISGMHQTDITAIIRISLKKQQQQQKKLY